MVDVRTSKLPFWLALVGIVEPCMADSGARFFESRHALLLCDDRIAVDKAEELARQGDSVAQFALSKFYEGGVGVSLSAREASMWKARSLESRRRDAEAGDADAMVWIGDSFRYGWATEINETRSKEWLDRGMKAKALKAESGDSEAMYSLALHLRDKDREQSNQWFRKALFAVRAAAEAGDPKAQERLGDVYHYGYGVVAEVEEAAKWYQPVVARWLAAAANADVLAMGNLYNVVHFGIGSARENKEARRFHDDFVSLYRSAAGRECVPAQTWMAQHFADLDAKDDQWSKYRALMWWMIAATSRDTRYRVFIEQAREALSHLGALERELVASKAARCLQTSYRICE